MSEPSHRIVLGVSGSIAAYKGVELLRLLTEAGHEVTVVPTPATLRFVGEPTWAALSGRRVITDLWSHADRVDHVTLGQRADLVLVAPTTANVLAKAAFGLADDALTNLLLATRAPVVFAPAMHPEMWEHPATTENVATLRRRGAIVIEPDVGRLTGVERGKGRLPAPGALATVAEAVLARDSRGLDLTGQAFVISAGGTHEPIDPVRLLANRSTGRQGVALAAAALSRGAAVTLVAANLEVDPPAGVTVVAVETAAEMQQAMRAEAKHADVVIMAAAVADFRAAQVAESKIKKETKGHVSLDLTRTEDILRDLVKSRHGDQMIVGFAAETGDADTTALDLARHKLASKEVDLLVFNDVSHGGVFGTTDTSVVLLHRDGRETPLPAITKARAAHAILDDLSR